LQDVAIVTDSSSGLPREILERLGIHMVPIHVTFGSQTYLDGVTMSTEEFYQRLDAGELPMTSQPSPGDFLALYRSLREKARSIISVHVSAKASGTCQSARLAAEGAPGTDITVIDSGSTSMGLGFMAMAGAEAALQGATRDRVLAVMEGIRSRLSVYATLPTLDYLRRSGRLSLGRALIASALSIKPVLTMREGLLEAIERPRSMNRAMDRMISLTSESVGNSPVRASVIYTRTRHRAEHFAEAVKRALNCLHEPYVLEMGPSLATHGGPGIMGLVTLKTLGGTP